MLRKLKTIKRTIKKTVKSRKVKVLTCEDRAREIERKAYLIWESKGRPQNCDLDNWLDAERSLN
ncbi:DUF2934 domain-containing protein [Candidatus Omnitrophota bacterium]